MGFRLAAGALALAASAAAYRVVPNNHGTPWPQSVYTQAQAMLAQMTVAVRHARAHFLSCSPPGSARRWPACAGCTFQ